MLIAEALKGVMVCSLFWKSDAARIFPIICLLVIMQMLFSRLGTSKNKSEGK